MRRPSLRLAPGSLVLGAAPQRINIRMAGSDRTETVVFNGRPLEVQLGSSD